MRLFKVFEHEIIDALTTIEASRLGSDDPSKLAFAASVGRTIYTFNVGDFAKLHSTYIIQNRMHSGIIVAPDQRCSIGEKIRRLASFISYTSAEKMVNRMEYL